MKEFTYKHFADMFYSYSEKNSDVAQEFLKEGDTENYEFYCGKSVAYKAAADFFKNLDEREKVE